MSVVRYRPARALTPLEADVSRLFNSFFEPRVSAGPTGIAPRRWVPAVDLVEGDGGYVLRADLPGLSEGDVTIEVENDVLTVSGKRETSSETKEDGYHRIERSSGSFSRRLKLPTGVETEQIKATFDKGVLEVKIPRPEQPQPHRIAIEAADK